MKQLFILRGLVGQGKSFIANILAKGLQDALILSADELRIIDGLYQFIPELEPYIWDEFEKQFNIAINENVPNIIIDNTNLHLSHYDLYKRTAIEAGYQVHELIIGDFNIDNSSKRCIHNVPIDKIQAMKETFEFPV